MARYQIGQRILVTERVYEYQDLPGCSYKTVSGSHYENFAGTVTEVRKSDLVVKCDDGMVRYPVRRKPNAGTGCFINKTEE